MCRRLGEQYVPGPTWLRRISHRRRNSVVRLYVMQNANARLAVMAYSASSLLLLRRISRIVR